MEIQEMEMDVKEIAHQLKQDEYELAEMLIIRISEQNVLLVIIKIVILTQRSESPDEEMDLKLA